MFRRKVTDQLMIWKEKYQHGYAALLEGARRVGKSVAAEEFARANYRSFIKVDFANISRELSEVFQDITNLDLFFLRLQAVTHRAEEIVLCRIILANEFLSHFVHGLA